MSSAADSALIAGMSLSIWFLCLSYQHSHATSMSLQHLLQKKIDDHILGRGTAVDLLPGRIHSRKDSRASSHANVYFPAYHTNTYITVGWKTLWKSLQKQSFETTGNTSSGKLTLFWTSACLLTFYSRFSPHLLITRIHFTDYPQFCECPEENLIYFFSHFKMAYTRNTVARSHLLHYSSTTNSALKFPFWDMYWHFN